MYLAYQTSKRGKCLSKQIGCCLKVGDLRFVGYFDTEAHVHACPLEVGLFTPGFNLESMCREVCKCGKGAVEWAIHKLVEYYTDKSSDRIIPDNIMAYYLYKGGDEEYTEAKKKCYIFGDGIEFGDVPFILSDSRILFDFAIGDLYICKSEKDLFDEKSWLHYFDMEVNGTHYWEMVK